MDRSKNSLMQTYTTNWPFSYKNLNTSWKLILIANLDDYIHNLNPTQMQSESYTFTGLGFGSYMSLIRTRTLYTPSFNLD